MVTSPSSPVTAPACPPQNIGSSSVLVLRDAPEAGGSAGQALRSNVSALTRLVNAFIAALRNASGEEGQGPPSKAMPPPPPDESVGWSSQYNTNGSSGGGNRKDGVMAGLGIMGLGNSPGRTGIQNGHGASNSKRGPAHISNRAASTGDRPGAGGEVS